jgi:hypothetical protein
MFFVKGLNFLLHQVNTGHKINHHWRYTNTYLAYVLPSGESSVLFEEVDDPGWEEDGSD